MTQEQPTAPFLTDVQQVECRRIVNAKITLHSQRAQAILLVDSGATHREAAAQTGLTLGQVRYVLKRFRILGLSVFPPLPQEKLVDEQKKSESKKDKKLKKEKDKKKKKKANKAKKEQKKKKDSDTKKKKAKKGKKKK